MPTASGSFPTAGRTVAASRSIPFGSTIIIDGHKYLVEDRLAKKYDSRIDIFMASHREAQQFGRKRKQVTIITKTNKGKL